MQMGPPNEKHQKLSAFAGNWKGEEILHPGPWLPQGAKAASKTVSKMGLGGYFLLMDYEQTRDGKVSYQGHGVYGWDQFQSMFTMHWFDVMGVDPGPPATGHWEGNKLQFRHSHPMGHGRYTYEFKPDGSYTFKLEHSQDGEHWMSFIDGTYKKA